MDKKYCEVVGYAVPALECAEIKSEKFHECGDCTSIIGAEIMSGGKRKYTMSEAALKARKETAIKAGAKRSRKISKDDYIPPPKKAMCLVAVNVGSSVRRLRCLTYGLCGECGPEIKEPVQAKAWEETGTKRPGDELRIVLDFTEFPEIYEELMALARNEMRTPKTQILYLLKYGNFDALKH